MRGIMEPGFRDNLRLEPGTAPRTASTWVVYLARRRAVTPRAATAGPDGGDATGLALAPAPAWLHPASAEIVGTGHAANDTRPDRLDVMARRREARRFRVDGFTVLLADETDDGAGAALARSEGGGARGFDPGPR